MIDRLFLPCECSYPVKLQHAFTSILMHQIAWLDFYLHVLEKILSGSQVRPCSI